MIRNPRPGEKVTTPGARIGTVVHVYTDDAGERVAFVRIDGVKYRYQVASLTLVR